MSTAPGVDPEAPQFGGVENSSSARYENASMGSQIIQPLSTQNSDAQLAVIQQQQPQESSVVFQQSGSAAAAQYHYQAQYQAQAAQYSHSSQGVQQYSPSALNSTYGAASQAGAIYQQQQQQQYGGLSTQYSTQQYSSGGGAYYTGQTGVTSTGQVYRSVSAATEGSRVIGHEYGAERVVSVTSRVDESRVSVISEQIVEHEVKVPKKIIREEVIEKIIVVPETQIREELVEDVQTIRERIREVVRPTIVEKVVEVPEIEYVEKIVEVPERVVQEKWVDKAVVVKQKRYHDVVKVVPQERIVEVPDIQYREVPVERVVQVPEYREEVIVREVPVPQYVDKPVPQNVDVEVFIDIDRSIPVPVEAVVAYEYRMPRMKPKYSKVTYPVYLPRFIEIPVAVELLNAGLLSQAEAYLASVNQLTRSAASLCEVETLAAQIMKSDFQSQLQHVDMQAAVLKAWQQNALGNNSAMMMPGTTMMPGVNSTMMPGVNSTMMSGVNSTMMSGVNSTMPGVNSTMITTTGGSASYQHGTYAKSGYTSVPMLGTTGAVVGPTSPQNVVSSSHREKKSKRTSKKTSS